MSFLLRSTKPYCLGIAIDRERWEINQLDIILNFQSHIMDAVTKISMLDLQKPVNLYF